MNPRNDRVEIYDQNDTPLIGCEYPHGRGTLPTSCLKPERKPREGCDWCLWPCIIIMWVIVILAWVYTPEIRAWIQKAVQP